nr:AAA family ATPase [Acidimicrobiia bacterium]
MPPGAVAPAASWPLVGRGRELDLLTLSLGTRRGRGGGAVLVGPPGVGKTRLAAEARALATRNGWVCLQAVPSVGAATIPLGALASVVGAAAEGGG